MIPLKSKAEIELMRVSGKMVSEILRALGREVRPGITTGELDRLAGQLIRDRGGRPAPPEVGFPGNICISVNTLTVNYSIVTETNRSPPHVQPPNISRLNRG